MNEFYEIENKKSFEILLTLLVDIQATQLAFNNVMAELLSKNNAQYSEIMKLIGENSKIIREELVKVLFEKYGKTPEI